MTLEVKTFLPEVSSEELAQTDVDELCRLVAKARVVEEMWRDIFAAAIDQTLGNKK